MSTSIEIFSAVDPNPGPVKHPGRVSGEPEPRTDYRNAPDRWLGPNTDIRNRKSLSPECIDELRDVAHVKGRPLSQSERDIIVRKFN